jgi:dipeptidyl aminopeptidase/acylaminoacyl peptidase
MPTTRPYGSWLSPITSELIVAGSIGLLGARFDGADIYWLESRPREQGRSVLVRQRPGSTPEDVTPAGFNVRSRVHEYGGAAATVHEGVSLFANMADQRLYRHAPGSDPVPLTPDGGVHRYADGIIDPQRGRWIGVRESHIGGDVINAIVAVDLASGGPGNVLAGGSDFYAAPRLSPDGRQLAWLSWQHPNMPWVETELWLADVDTDGVPAAPRTVAGGAGESVLQPEWSPDGALHFISDRSGWWNLFRLNGGVTEALCPREADFAQPPWVFGMSSYAFVGRDRIVCTFWENGLGRLAQLGIAKRVLVPIDLPYTDYGSLHAREGEAVFRAASPHEASAIVRLDLASGKPEVLRRSSVIQQEFAGYFSVPEHITFPTEYGRSAHAFYYPPASPDFVDEAGARAPLLVKCHGGPTAFSPGVLDLRTQYWTSRGIGVLDVNYGGSSSYGRTYRDRLHGQWGVVDVDDCINAARFLVQRGSTDPDRIVITGGSAGGYTTLMVLTRNAFAGGASHYGVSDVAALARDTHKFESRYLDWLIAPLAGNEELYRERSPLHHADSLSRPVIFFQGDEDKVVPSNQTEVMVAALRSKGVPVGYLLFSGEQHGFRKASNIMRALDAELYFYAALVFRTGLAF